MFNSKLFLILILYGDNANSNIALDKKGIQVNMFFFLNNIYYGYAMEA